MRHSNPQYDTETDCVGNSSWARLFEQTWNDDTTPTVSD